MTDDVAGPKSWVRFGEGGDRVTWPHPDDPREVEWQLRYGSPDSVRLIAASYVRAYRYLIELPHRQRNQVVQSIKEAAKEQTCGD